MIRSIHLIYPLCAASALIAGCTTLQEAPRDATTSRTAVTRDGDVVGYIERHERDVPNGRQFITRQTLRVTVAGTQSRTIVEEATRTEDHQRKTTALAHQSMVGRHQSLVTAKIDGDTVTVRRSFDADSRMKSIRLPTGTRFDNGAGLLRNWNDRETATLAFFELDIRGPLIERVVYSSIETENTTTNRSLLRQVFVDNQLRSESKLFFDKSGTLLGSDQPMFGQDMQTAPSSATSANNAATNPVRSSLMKSPYRIPGKAMKGHMRYTFASKSIARFLPPATGEQRVTPTADGFVLDVCATCGPGLNSSDTYLQSARVATFWLQSDHRLLLQMANRAKDSATTDAEKMARLERLARRRMKSIDFAGHFSAVEALRRRAGDCTEGAVVLAALGRAAGIPTKVASGIVYSRERYHGVSHTFTPHAWTLAYIDGKWQSFDMSLNGFDATHIAFTISDGDPGSIQAGHQLAALLEWKQMTEIRRRVADTTP